MVFVDRMMISILSVSVEGLEMSCAEAAEALSPRALDMKPCDLLRPLHLMCDSGIPIYPVSSSDVRYSPLGPVQILFALVFRNVSSANQTMSCTP